MSLKSGLPLLWTGTVTLVGGTITLTNIPNINSDDLGVATVKTASGTLGNHYEITVGANQFTISAIDTAGNLVATDTSTVSICIFKDKYL